jgi:hypothetical protein
LGGRGRWISEFEASLVYKVSSRTARATQRNPVSKKTKPKPTKQEERAWRHTGSCVSAAKGFLCGMAHLSGAWLKRVWCVCVYVCGVGVWGYRDVADYRA